MVMRECVSSRSGGIKARDPVLLLQEAAAPGASAVCGWARRRPTRSNSERRLIPTHRPLTHQLICQVIGSCGHRLDRVCSTSLHEGTFHAELVISLTSGCRAVSDAGCDGPCTRECRYHAAAPCSRKLRWRTCTCRCGLDEGDDPTARPVAESAELERLRRSSTNAKPRISTPLTFRAPGQQGWPGRSVFVDLH